MYLGIYYRKTTKDKQYFTKKNKQTNENRKKKKGAEQDTTKADCVILAKSFLFNAFSMENPPANTV